MSHIPQTSTPPKQRSAGPVVLLSGAALAAAALVGGLWLGGAFGSRTADGDAPRRVAPAPAAQDSAMASGATSGVAPAQPVTSQEQPSGDAKASAANTDDASGDATTGAHGASTGATDGSGTAMDAAAAAPPAIDPADLYQVTYADHEPQALTAAAQGTLGTPALVMFHADWCHVCQEVMPTVHDLREQYKGELAVVKVNVDQRDPAMAAYPVRGTPTFVLFDRHGEAIKTQSGWPGESLMAQYLDAAVAIQ